MNCLSVPSRHTISFPAVTTDASLIRDMIWLVSRTQTVTYGERGFWAYDVAVGVFLKYLIDAAQASGEAKAPWLSEVVSSWRLWAVVSDFGLRLDERWSAAHRKIFIALVEEACAALATRDSIPDYEIVNWHLCA